MVLYFVIFALHRTIRLIQVFKFVSHISADPLDDIDIAGFSKSNLCMIRINSKIYTCDIGGLS
jgi:hypothetical protein